MNIWSYEKSLFTLLLKKALMMWFVMDDSNIEKSMAYWPCNYGSLHASFHLQTKLTSSCVYIYMDLYNFANNIISILIIQCCNIQNSTYGFSILHFPSSSCSCSCPRRNGHRNKLRWKLWGYLGWWSCCLLKPKERNSAHNG